MNGTPAARERKGGAGGAGGATALALGVFLGALDQTVVATLLSPMILDLEIPFTRLQDAAWIVTAYLLGYTIAMPLVGRIADLRGRVRVYVACTLLFAVASVGCGAATSLEWLIAARAVQAVGGGALLPVALAIAGDSANVGRRSLAIGVVGAIAEAGGVLGPLYGAGLVQWLSWRWVFYLNLPIGIVIALLVWWKCPEQPRATGRVDMLGGLVLALVLGLLTLGLSLEGSVDRPAWIGYALVGGAALMLILFVVTQRRVAHPLIDLGLFRKGPFTAANVTNVLVGAALISAMVDVPLWSATVLGRSTTEGGLLLVRMTLFIPVGALLGGWSTRRLGPRGVAVAGLLCCATSFALLAQWSASVDDGTMGRDLALGGLGFGLLLAPLTTTAIAWAGDARAAVAAALVTLMRMVGMMVGLSALTSFGLGRFNQLVRGLPLPLGLANESAAALAERQSRYAEQVLSATVTVFHEIFIAAALLCLFAILPALAMRLPAGNAGPSESPRVGVVPSSESLIGDR